MTVLYVCTDTRWQSVNLVPALKIGSIDRFLFLSARRGGDFVNSDAAHAKRPQQQLITAYDLERIRTGHNHSIEALGIVVGPLVGVHFWREKIAAEVQNAPTAAEIIVNYLSGPSDVKVGAWLALEDIARVRPDLRLRCVLYDAPGGGQPSRLEWNERSEGGWCERLEPIDHLLSSDGWLQLHGFRELDRRFRADREALAVSLQPVIEAMYALVYEDPGLPPGWFIEISGAIRHETANDLYRLCRQRLPHAAEPACVEGLRKLAQIATAVAPKLGGPAKIEIDGFSGQHDFIEFFRSTWFEMLVFLECRRRLPKKTAAEVMFDVRLELAPVPDVSEVARAAAQPEASPYQLDVAVLGNNQLHVIECKALRSDTSTKRARQNRTHLNHLRRAKEELVGPGGIALMAAALPGDSASSTARYAEFGHLEFAAGWPNMSAALDRIASRCV